MASWSLLDEKEEAELHKSRLLNVEEKPFKRITKRLVSLSSLAAIKASQPPTPPQETADERGTGGPAIPQPAAADDDDDGPLSDTKEDIVLDFAAFDGSITRLQLLLSANERERARYAADRVRILDTSQTVRDSMVRLRLRLEQARATLQQRRRFDELADRITNNRMLRPRADQAANLRKLEEECAQLEAESETYAATWLERRDQFSRIMDESMRLRRLIRDEKEEVERREGMDDEGGQGDAEADSSVQTPRPGLGSGNATPRPDSGAPAAAAAAAAATTAASTTTTATTAAGAGSGAGAAAAARSGLDAGDNPAAPSRPASTVGGATPAMDSPAPGRESQGSLKPLPDPAGTFSRSSHASSRSGSPSREGDGERQGPTEGDDVEMGDAKASSDSTPVPVPADDTPRIVLGSPVADDEDSMDMS